MIAPPLSLHKKERLHANRQAALSLYFFIVLFSFERNSLVIRSYIL